MKGRGIYNPSRFSLCLNISNPKFYLLIEDISKNVFSFFLEPVFDECLFFAFIDSIIPILVCESIVAVFPEKKIYCFISHYFKPKGAVMMLVLAVISGISAERNGPAGPVHSFLQQRLLLQLEPAPRLVPSSLNLLIYSFGTCLSLKQSAGRGLSLTGSFCRGPYH